MDILKGGLRAYSNALTKERKGRRGEGGKLQFVDCRFEKSNIRESVEQKEGEAVQSFQYLRRNDELWDRSRTQRRYGRRWSELAKVSLSTGKLQIGAEEFNRGTGLRK